jgi:hypothetical protein
MAYFVTGRTGFIGRNGEKAPEEKASTEAVALAHLMRGVHW